VHVRGAPECPGGGRSRRPEGHRQQYGHVVLGDRLVAAPTPAMPGRRQLLPQLGVRDRAHVVPRSKGGARQRRRYPGPAPVEPSVQFFDRLGRLLSLATRYRRAGSTPGSSRYASEQRQLAFPKRKAGWRCPNRACRSATRLLGRYCTSQSTVASTTTEPPRVRIAPVTCGESLDEIRSVAVAPAAMSSVRCRSQLILIADRLLSGAVACWRPKSPAPDRFRRDRCRRPRSWTIQRTSTGLSRRVRRRRWNRLAGIRTAGARSR
jgi:hypothetical protein